MQKRVHCFFNPVGMKFSPTKELHVIAEEKVFHYFNKCDILIICNWNGETERAGGCFA